MKRSLNKYLLTAIFVAVITPLVFLGQGGFTVVSAQTTVNSNPGLEITAGQAGLKTSETDPQKIVGDIIRKALGFLGIIFIILMISGGFIWMTAQGDATRIKKARGIVTSAAIGIVIILASYSLVYYIFINTQSILGDPAAPGSTGDMNRGVVPGAGTGCTNDESCPPCEDGLEAYCRFNLCECGD